jgi:hypothetical protein
MPRHLPRPHERLEILEPCSADWDSMVGDDRARFCAHCRKHVHNLSEVTPREALDLVLRTGGRLCLSIERDPQGVPRTRALVEPLYRIGRRASRLAAGAFGAALTLGSAAATRAQTAGPAPPAVNAPAAPVPAEASPVAGTTVANQAIMELPPQ